MPPDDERLELLQESPPPDEEGHAQPALALALEKQSLENARLGEQLQDLQQDRDQRRKYSDRLFRLIVTWLVAVGAVLLLHGFTDVRFALAVPVLTTLIGATTASVLGLFAIVANYLFPKR